MNKIVIVVKDTVSGTSTNSEAFPLFIKMDNELSSGKHVVLSLKSCNPMSSSFLNSSFGSVIEKYGWDFLKGKISIIDYTPTIADTIKTYLDKSKSLSVVN